MVETNTPITGIDPSKLESNGQDIRDAKILELAKKVQKQNATIESQKTKIKNLEEEIKLRKQIHESKMSEEIGLPPSSQPSSVNTKASGGSTKVSNTSKEPNSNDQSNQIKQLLKDVNNLRMKLTTCEGEVKKYKLLLQREIGDNVKISDVIDNESEWKGRQEIIMSLQAKIKKLESQSSNKISNERYYILFIFTDLYFIYIFRAEKAINGIEKEKKVKLQDLTEKCKSLEEANNTYKSNSIYLYIFLIFIINRCSI